MNFTCVAAALWRSCENGPSGCKVLLKHWPAADSVNGAPRRPREFLRFALCLLLLACVLPGTAGCGGDPSGGPPGGGPAAPAGSNPVALAFRSTELGAPAASDGRNYRSPEFMGHHGLAAISADGAYQRGYFGQDVTIAVADDGLDPTHPDLAGRIRAPRHVRNSNANVFETGRAGDFGFGHGTYVALLAAGARDNAAGTFEIRDAGGGAVPTYNVHGVAPRASVMPIQLDGGGQPMQAMEHAVANRAQVLNFSIGLSEWYYGKYAGRDGVWLAPSKPLFRPLIERGLVAGFLSREFAGTARVLGNRDIVAVWAAGNESWNSINNRVHMCGKNYIGEDGCTLGELAITAEEFMENFSWLHEGDDGDRDGPTVSFRDMWGTDCGGGDCADYNSIGGWALAPLFQPGLLGKWLVVGALDRNGGIARFSNGCGEARNWCLFAPGQGLRVGPNEALDGTSFAAPLVSGALAVLKSRLRALPMEVVQAVLLYSADPLGTRVNNPDEPDPVYGWGRLNLGSAIAMQGTVRLPYSVAETARSFALRDARITLSPALAHVGGGLKAVPVAVGGVRGAYYNMALSRIVDVRETRKRFPAHTRAAASMFAPMEGHYHETHGAFITTDPETGGVRSAGSVYSDDLLGAVRFRYDLCDGCERSPWREWDAFDATGPSAAAPFFAVAGGTFAFQGQGNGVRPFAALSGSNHSRTPWWQLGLQWSMSRGGFGLVAEVSHINEKRSFWGTHPGALGEARTATRQGRLLLSRALGGNWRVFLGYEHAAGKVSVGGGMLSGISGLRAAGRSAGIEGRGVFRDSDRFRFSTRQGMRISGGRARISHVVATGAGFAEAFYLGRPQSLERRRIGVDLRARPATAYALGYSLPLGESARFALGLEYESESSNSGVSLGWRMKF
ncbi:MAG: S8 family serine peptidase [Nitrospinae bacterium]|nr:S8 family serine peptidase [Nitrospinota bacterium]